MKKVSSISLLFMLGLILGTGVAHAQSVVKEGKVVAYVKEYKVLATHLETCKQNPLESSNKRYSCEVSLDKSEYALFAGSKFLSGENQFQFTGQQPSIRFAVTFSPKLGGYNVTIERYGRRTVPGKQTSRPSEQLEKTFKKAEGTTFQVIEFRLAE